MLICPTISHMLSSSGRSSNRSRGGSLNGSRGISLNGSRGISLNGSRGISRSFNQSRNMCEAANAMRACTICLKMNTQLFRVDEVTLLTIWA